MFYEKLSRYRTLALVAVALVIGAGGSWFYTTAQQRRQPAPPPVPMQEYLRIYREATKIGLIRPREMLSALSDDAALLQVAREVEDKTIQMVDEAK